VNRRQHRRSAMSTPPVLRCCEGALAPEREDILRYPRGRVSV
jgi:hypothetical protein